MYQTSNRRDLPEEWIQWMFYFSMCHDRFNVLPPCLRLMLSGQRFVSWSSASEAQCLTSQSPQTLSAALSLGLRQSQHGQTLAPVSPQQWLQRGLREGLWANMEITVDIKECIWQKYWRLRCHIIIKGRAARDLLASQKLFNSLFFALVITLYWALSDWTVHYINVQGKILLLHYTFSKIYTE